MIVVATHNSPANLERLLRSMEIHGTDGQKVLLVASGSPEFMAYMETVKTDRFELGWIPNPTDSFETGAFVEAYRHRPDAKYLFLQDSMEITGAGWYQQFEKRWLEYAATAPNLDVCIPWVTFTPYLLGVTPSVRERIVTTYGLMGEPGFGIFGSMFFTLHTTLQKLENAGYLNYLPKDKIDSEAFERWWALFFHRLQIPMFAVHADGFGHLHHARGDGFPLLRKHFHDNAGAARG